MNKVSRIQRRIARMIYAWNPFEHGSLLELPCRQAKTACNIWDITEEKPIPSGVIVDIEDFWQDDGDYGIFVVEWEGRIYLAEPSELIAHY